MNLINKTTHIVKKSQFIAYYYEIKDKNEVKEILTSIRLEHKKAKHIVYAYRVQNTAGKSDDKEPSNSAGTPLYLLLEKNNLNNHLLVVVRYFGGILLGRGPLKRAYNTAGLLAIKK